MDKNIRRSRRQEKRGAELFGGKVTPGSGNKWFARNDMITDRFSFEFKTTTFGSFTLKLPELLTAEKNALMDGLTMAFGIQIQDRNYVLLTEEDFAELEHAAGVNGTNPS